MKLVTIAVSESLSEISFVIDLKDKDSDHFVHRIA